MTRPVVVFVDKRGLGDPKARPFVVAQDGIVVKKVRSLRFHGRGHFRYAPKGIPIYDTAERIGGWIVCAYLEYRLDE